MGSLGFTSTIAILSILVSSIYGQCNQADLESRLSTCANTADNIVNSNECSGLENSIASVYNCFAGCKNIHPDLVQELDKLTDSVESAFMSRCASSGPADARDGGPAAACDIGTIFGCVTNLGSVISLPANADISSLKGVCNVIGDISGFLNSCGILVTDCLGFLGNTFENELNQIRYGIRVGNELSNGGCDCAQKIEIAADAYGNLPKSTTALRIICPAVEATTYAVKAVLDDCVNQLNTAVGGPTLDWLTITLNYINIVNPFVGLVCGTSTIMTSAAVTLGLGLLTALAAGLLHFMRR